MRRAPARLWLNVITFVNFVALAATGAILRWVLPSGSAGWHGIGKGWRGGRAVLESVNADSPRPNLLFGWGRHYWADLHFWLAVLLVANVILHIILHWSWIRSKILPGWMGGKCTIPRDET